MKWIEVVTNPLGLAAFALALVFGVLGVKLAARKSRWFLPVAITLAALTIVGGLFLAYQDVQSKEKRAAIAAPQDQTGKGNQETHGHNSPAVRDVKGDVIINQRQDGPGK